MIGFINLINTLLGICFVIRNRVDVPKFIVDKEKESKFMTDPRINESGEVSSNYSRYGFTRIKKGDRYNFYMGSINNEDTLLSSSSTLDNVDNSS